MPTWDDVVEIAGRLPGCEVSSTYATPSLKVRGKFMCRLRSDPDALVVRCLDLADASALKLGQPDVFFSTPHYDGWPVVLVNLDTVTKEQLFELIEDAWRLQAAKRVVAAYDAGE
jgi:hypothetical protein